MDHLYLQECINLLRMCVRGRACTRFCAKAPCYLFNVTSVLFLSVRVDAAICAGLDKSKLCIIRRGHALHELVRVVCIFLSIRVLCGGIFESLLWKPSTAVVQKRRMGLCLSSLVHCHTSCIIFKDFSLMVSLRCLISVDSSAL